MTYKIIKTYLNNVPLALSLPLKNKNRLKSSTAKDDGVFKHYFEIMDL